MRPLLSQLSEKSRQFWISSRSSWSERDGTVRLGSTLVLCKASILMTLPTPGNISWLRRASEIMGLVLASRSFWKTCVGSKVGLQGSCVDRRKYFWRAKDADKGPETVVPRVSTTRVGSLEAACCISGCFSFIPQDLVKCSEVIAMGDLSKSSESSLASPERRTKSLMEGRSSLLHGETPLDALPTYST